MAGMGQFSLPFAFTELGSTTLLIISVFAFLCAYTGVLLARTMAHFDALDERNGSPRAERTWNGLLQLCVPGAVGRTLSAIVLIAMVALFVSYLILVGTNFSIVMAHLFQHHIAVDCSILICSCIIFFAAAIPTHYFDRFSMVGLLITVMCTGFLWINYASPQNTRPAVPYQDMFFLEAWPTHKFSLRGMASGIGDVMLCFGLHWSFPSVYYSSGDRENLSKVFALVVFTGALLFAFTAAVGFACWGDNVKQVFSSNLGRNSIGEDVPGLQIMRPCLSILIVMKVIVSSPVLLWSIATNVENLLRLSAASWKTNTLNLLVLVSTSAMAMTFGDKCAHAISFAGAADVVTMIVGPCAMYLAIAADDLSFSEKLFVQAILVFGILLGVIAAAGSGLRLAETIAG